ncbi:hypothetical protein DICVIV_13119 [Dictyocaulus viviparus]|uniref:Uncharacterized protein n=1 Tax=Dictyocaulus viviparus TaxID=29172 RepID=A0A0D8XER1_DICVI|nr:hypothetical protein DICVIV_13119 [Dictyocaulus viviparus]
MSVEETSDKLVGQNMANVLAHDWIHEVEREETIGTETVNEGEVEEFIEVDGVVDEHSIGRHIQLYPNEVVSSSLRNGSEIYSGNVSAAEDLTMNLPDLMSRVISFTNGSKMYLCFSKKCRKQLSFEGHLYNIDGYVSTFDANVLSLIVKSTNWNLWRCANPSCTGAIRTSPSITELRIREPHNDSCRREDIQIRLRIAVYDLRLMAEFTDLPLDALYDAYLDKVMNEYKDIAHLFPPFETLKMNLEEHRCHLTCSQCGLHDFQSVCVSCNTEFRSTPESSSQDQLVEHVFFDHKRKSAVINRFTFDEPGLFEVYNNRGFFQQWVRELQYHSKFRLKKMCLHDENMYYLCQSDVRHFKNNHSRFTIPSMHCTAFIRVHDWRHVIQGEVNEVVVDYCLDHSFHNEESMDSLSSYKDTKLFTPEVFIRDLAARRERTQQLIQDKGLQRIKRRCQPPSILISNAIHKSRKLETIGSNSSTYNIIGDSMGNCSKEGDELTDNNDVFGISRSQQRQKVVQQLVQGRCPSRDYARRLSPPRCITKRENFADSDTYDSVLQFEISCDMLKERMQYARNIRTANHYLARLTHIVDDVMADPLCAPSNLMESTPNIIRSSKHGVSHSTKMPLFFPISSPSSTSQVVEYKKTSNLSREPKSEPNDSFPLCQKVLVRKGDKGQLVVVKRTILGKVRKVISDTEMKANQKLSHQEVQSLSQADSLFLQKEGTDGKTTISTMMETNATRRSRNRRRTHL